MISSSRILRMLWRDLYLSVLLLAVVAATLFSTVPTSAQSLAIQLSGKILLQVEAHGEAWYVYPDTHERYYLGRPDDAFRIMRELGLGISNADLAKIPEAGTTTTGDRALRTRLSGKILLQIEAHGEAWYVNPETTRRHYLGRPDDAYNLMRTLGLGITNLNLISIPVAADGGTVVAPTSQPSLNDGHDSVRVQLLGSINAERASKGLPAYVLQHELSQAAQAQADDMNALGYVDFTSPTGSTIKDFAAAANYNAHTLAENIAQTSSAVTSLVPAWKQEQGMSYTNVVHPSYEHVGVGVTSVDGSTVYTVVFALSFDTFFKQQTAALSDIDAVRAEMLERVNLERAKVSVAPLTMNHLLNLSAQGHADDMFNRAYYSHESPEGSTVFDRVQITGYQPRLASENIAKNQFSVTEVMDSWMASEGHRLNLLDTRVVDVGFGLAYGITADGYAILWVQNFAEPQ